MRASAYVGEQGEELAEAVLPVVQGEQHGDRGKPDENLIKQKGLVKRSYKKF